MVKWKITMKKWKSLSKDKKICGILHRKENEIEKEGSWISEATVVIFGFVLFFTSLLFDFFAKVFQNFNKF